jgi:hypothetical protein
MPINKSHPMMRRQYLRIDDCTEEQMYQVLSTLMQDVDQLKEKQPSLDDLRRLYRLMLSRQLKDWKANKKYSPNAQSE